MTVSNGVIALRSGPQDSFASLSALNSLVADVNTAQAADIVPTISGLTAAGTNRATALTLSYNINNVTTAAASTGVLLQAGAGVPGQTITIFNNGANAIQVYAVGSETIDGVAGSTGVPLTNAKRAVFYCTAALTWISAQLGVVSA